ncbi:MAG: AAA family ATPase [Bryobacteraceae bacterium]
MPVRAGSCSFVERIRRLSQWAVLEGTPEVKQTHISVVLIGRDHVLKLKKPVDLGFLDYTTMEKRRRACSDEVRLNRRLCPSVYLGVRAIVDDGSGIRLIEEPGANANILDYGVWMKRLPEEGMLERLVAEGSVTHRCIRAIAGRLAEFHKTARREADVLRWGLPDAIAWNWRENFEQTERFVGRTIDRGVRDAIRSWVEGWMAANRDLLLERVSKGCVVDGHGDVRCESICIGEDIYIFDCVEFNDRFRCGDVSSETAFLAADLDSRGRPDLGYFFTREYEALSGDGELWKLLPFYRCYRAFVRGKVSCFVSADEAFPAARREAASRRAARHFDLARRYASPLQSRVLMAVGGLSGTGKTSLARAVAGELGLEAVSSDSVRHELFGEEKAPAAFGTGVYGDECTARTYREMISRARRLLQQGRGVVLDATFLQPEFRRLAMAAAADEGALWRFVECRLDAATVRRRMAERATQGDSESDATFEIHQRQRELAGSGSASGDGGDHSMVADTGGELWQYAHRVSDWLRQRTDRFAVS